MSSREQIPISLGSRLRKRWAEGVGNTPGQAKVPGTAASRPVCPDPPAISFPPAQLASGIPVPLPWAWPLPFPRLHILGSVGGFCANLKVLVSGLPEPTLCLWADSDPCQGWMWPGVGWTSARLCVRPGLPFGWRLHVQRSRQAHVVRDGPHMTGRQGARGLWARPTSATLEAPGFPASSPSDPPQDQGLERAPAAVLASAHQRSVSEAHRKPPPGRGLQEGGGGGRCGAERRAPFDAPHKPLSVQQGTHSWADKQGDKRCLQRLQAASPLSWLAKGSSQRSSPMGRPFPQAGRRAQGSFSTPPPLPFLPAGPSGSRRIPWGPTKCSVYLSPQILTQP